MRDRVMIGNVAEAGATGINDSLLLEFLRLLPTGRSVLCWTTIARRLGD